MVDDSAVLALLDALTAELAEAGYTREQTFGYTPEQLAAGGVHMVGAVRHGELVGVGGIELQSHGLAELKRFYVVPDHRGVGVADAILHALLAYAMQRGADTLRLETGDRQCAARAFYRRHGFVEVPRFAPYQASATSVCMQRAVKTVV